MVISIAYGSTLFTGDVATVKQFTRDKKYSRQDEKRRVQSYSFVIYSYVYIGNSAYNGMRSNWGKVVLGPIVSVCISILIHSLV